MTIAFDVDIFCDANGNLAPGMIDMMIGIFTMNPKNKFYVWSVEGIQEARRRGVLAQLPRFVSYQDRRAPDEIPGLSFLKIGTKPKGATVVWVN